MGDDRYVVDIREIDGNLCRIAQAAIAGLGGDHQLRASFIIEVPGIVHQQLIPFDAEGRSAIAIGIDIVRNAVGKGVALGVGCGKCTDHRAPVAVFGEGEGLVIERGCPVVAFRCNANGIGHDVFSIDRNQIGKQDADGALGNRPAIA